MSAAIIASLSPVTITIGATTTVLATESVGVPLGIIHTLHHHSGNVFPTLVAVPGADRRVTLSIPLKTALTVFGLALVKVTAFSAFLAKFDDYNRLPGANHAAVALASGCAAAAQITGWSANVDGIIMASVEIVPLSSDGQVDPLELLTGVSLPAISGSPALHTLGPVDINGTVVPGLSGHSGSIGSTIAVQRTDGDLYARVCARIEAAPTMQLSHSDPTTLLSNLTLMGKVITNVVVWAKSYDAATGIATQAQSISFTMVSGRIQPSGPDSRQGSVASTDVEVLGISDDGAANPIAISLSATAPVSP